MLYDTVLTDVYMSRLIIRGVHVYIGQMMLSLAFPHLCPITRMNWIIPDIWECAGICIPGPI